MLDAAKELGFKVEVHDESDFWDDRDFKALVGTVGEWDKFICSFAGALKDAMGKEGMGVSSATDGRPDFERLEAEGVLDTKTAKMIECLVKAVPPPPK
jgi:hypothetical protein